MCFDVHEVPFLELHQLAQVTSSVHPSIAHGITVLGNAQVVIHHHSGLLHEGRALQELGGCTFRVVQCQRFRHALHDCRRDDRLSGVQ